MHETKVPWDNYDLSLAVNSRYYEGEPELKTLGECYDHGVDHGLPGWSRQVDPRWGHQQIAAYLDGYTDGRIFRAAGYVGQPSNKLSCH